MIFSPFLCLRMLMSWHFWDFYWRLHSSLKLTRLWDLFRHRASTENSNYATGLFSQQSMLALCAPNHINYVFPGCSSQLGICCTAPSIQAMLQWVSGSRSEIYLFILLRGAQFLHVFSWCPLFPVISCLSSQVLVFKYCKCHFHWWTWSTLFWAH